MKFGRGGDMVMPDLEQLMTGLGVIVVAAPAMLVVILGIPTLLKWRLNEATIARCTQVAVVSGLLAALAILALMLGVGTRHVVIDLGEWVEVPRTYHFSVKFVFDRLSVPMVLLSFVLIGTVGAFARHYMHRERGYNRFFMLYALFLLGMVVASLAGTIEALFAGWELVGLSSALLVAYFQERPAPPRNGLWVWSIYRVSDAALLLAAVVMHHDLLGEGDFDALVGPVSWPEGHAVISAGPALIVGLLLLAAAAGKSGLVPFSGWLPRAMEGPTPSSAVFYGALSVHLGAYLLLRAGPILECSALAATAVLVLGLLTASYAYLTSTVQTDIKSALAFAALAQVGLIVAEIGLAALLAGLPASDSTAAWLGAALYYVALVHLLGHACLRTLQFVRAPTLLHDYHTLENAIGDHLPAAGAPLGRLPVRPTGAWLYRLLLQRGYLDALLVDYVVGPFLRVMRWCDGLERRWTDLLSGQASRESDQVKQHAISMEELT